MNLYSGVVFRQLAEVERLAVTQMFTIYAIYNKKHNKLYIGQTEDLEQRLELYASKKFSRSYTARYDDKWELIYKEKTPTRQEALKRERQLKSYRGREFIKKYIPE